MELVLLGLVPVIFLLVATAMLVVSQISGFMQFSAFSARQKRNTWMIQRFLEQVALAKSQLGRRSRELEALSKRLRLNNEELARLNTMKTKFLSMAVHDVRTPLTSVKGFSDMLGHSQNLGDKEKKFVTYISRAADQIGRLLGDLTDLALIEAGKYKLEMSSFDINDIVNDITPSVGFVAQTKGVSLVVGEIPAGVPLTADRFRLGRVLQNLLGNAVKFTPAGGRVELRAHVAGSWLTFQVKDTGPGIHPSERVKIFQKFYQSVYTKDAKAKAAGWGLGLAISEEIVRSHGGQIGVDSPGLGRGSTFWVKVPLVPPRRPRPATVVRAAAAAALLLLAGVPAVRAQTLPLEEKARYEASLEQRVEGVLLHMLGPNRYKVVVEATMDFTRIEKFETKEGTTTATSHRSLPYMWGDVQGPNGEAQSELLPGVPMSPTSPNEANPNQPNAGGPQQAGNRPQSYERRNSFAPEFLKRLAVTVILDTSVSKKETEDVRAIVTEILDITPIRGDTLSVVQSAFMPLWKTIWQEPQMAGLMVKYIMIGFLSIMTLVVVAVSMLKLSNAMKDMAEAQKNSLTMGMDPAAGAGDKDEEELEEGEGAAGALEGPKAGEQEASTEELVRFLVRPGQVEALADMMRGENAANVALVVEHLEPEIRVKLLAVLPPEVSESVFASLGRVRYVEPDVILNIKEELERRLSGAVGGLGKVVAMLESAELSERKRMFDAISARDPGLGEQLRRKVFMIENLACLTHEEWSLVQSRVNYEDWALALADGPVGVKDALLENVPEKARKVLDQMIASRPGDATTRRTAQDKIAKVVAALAAEGRLGDLAERAAALAAEAPPAEPQDGAAAEPQEGTAAEPQDGAAAEPQDGAAAPPPMPDELLEGPQDGAAAEPPAMPDGLPEGGAPDGAGSDAAAAPPQGGGAATPRPMRRIEMRPRPGGPPAAEGDLSPGADDPNRQDDSHGN